jgi:hypothetical protein
MQPSLEMLKNQRNYLAHNLFDLLIGLIEETLLPRDELLDSDVHTYTEKAWLLEENLNGLADIVAKERRGMHITNRSTGRGPKACAAELKR